MINPAFLNYTQEAALLGAMVIGYGELELSYLHTVGIAIEQKFEILEACHNVRTEGGRIAIAHALGRHVFERRNLGKEYSRSYDAIRHCLKIRNQYTHSHWADIGDSGLMFTNAEDAFKNGPKMSKWKSIDLELLQQQEAFFENCRKWFLYIEVTLATRTARGYQKFSPPEKLLLPPLHNRVEGQVRT